MAHSTAMNTLTENIVLSLISTSGNDAAKLRRARDTFTRRLKHHNFARTNQFEVAERVMTVEEKLQILNHDDLSDALHDCVAELSTYDNPWIPDALDLLLRLSIDPTSKADIETLQKASHRSESPAALNWSEIEVDDPIDRDDPIWHVQDYSDLSSDEDVYEKTSQAASPTTSKPYSREGCNGGGEKSLFLPVDQDCRKAASSRLEEAQFWRSADETVSITELQAIRECLFLLQGLPTTLFADRGTVLVPNSIFREQHLSQESLSEILTAFGKLGQQASKVRRWLEKPQQLHYMQRMRAGIQQIVIDFDSTIARIQTKLINPGKSTIISLINVFNLVEDQAKGILGLQVLIDELEVPQKRQRHPLDMLFDHICLSQSRDGSDGTAVMEVFSGTFDLYMRPVIKWMTAGKIDPNLDPFFVQAGTTDDRSRLWNDWFVLDEKVDTSRPPVFMKPFSHQIFACGKTIVFLRALRIHQVDRVMSSKFDFSFSNVRKSVESGSMPFREALSTAMTSAVVSAVRNATSELQHELGERCGLWATLEALGHVYFADCGHIIESIDSKIFARIDQCDDRWNDHFIVADLLEHKFSEIGGVDVERLVIHSKYVSSRSMESRRQSVKIMEDVSVEYVLPWPLANVISQSALGSYRRVALLLVQIRRAKHSLLRKAHFFVQNGLLHIDAGDRKFAQALHFSLLLFVETLYNHLTSLVIVQSTAQMRHELKGAADIEILIATFGRYVNRLEEACLTTKKLKVVRDAVTSLLDLCIRFSDVVSAPIDRRHSDLEASSFISARSRHDKRHKSEQEEVSADEDMESDEGEGYSSFVVLENSSPADEIRKIKTQFDRQLGFVVAALRGLGKSGSHSTNWEILAERLDWKKRPLRAVT